MLTIKNLTKTYGNGVRAMDGVTLDIPKGMFGLLGPNGAGKSTLMRTLATLQAPDTGEATFGEIDIVKNPRRCAPRWAICRRISASIRACRRGPCSTISPSSRG
jgi:ABC-type multidrug transport system ATPase subunit